MKSKDRGANMEREKYFFGMYAYSGWLFQFRVLLIIALGPE